MTTTTTSTNVSRIQSAILKALVALGGKRVPAHDIVEKNRRVLQHGTIRRHLNKCEAKGFVRYSESKEAGRNAWVWDITPAGRRAVK